MDLMLGWPGKLSAKTEICPLSIVVAKTKKNGYWIPISNQALLLPCLRKHEIMIIRTLKAFLHQKYNVLHLVLFHSV